MKEDADASLPASYPPARITARAQQPSVVFSRAPRPHSLAAVVPVFLLVLPNALKASGSAQSWPGDTLLQPGPSALAVARDIRGLFARPLAPLAERPCRELPLLAAVPM